MSYPRNPRVSRSAERRGCQWAGQSGRGREAHSAIKRHRVIRRCVRNRQVGKDSQAVRRTGLEDEMPCRVVVQRNIAVAARVNAHKIRTEEKF